MKKPLVFLIAAFYFAQLSAQNSLTENKVIIVSCKTGDLYVDGTLVGKIEAEDARQQALSPGEHYLQVKTPTEKFNLTAKIDLNTKDIIRIGCDNGSQVAVPTTAVPATPTTVLLFDKQLNLGGALTSEVQQNIVALDEGDNILLTCAVMNKKGSANISIKLYPDGTEIFRNEGFNTIDQQKILIPSKGIYIINVTTGALFGKDIKLAVARIPSAKSDLHFKTTVRKYNDTIFKEILNTSAVVHSTTNAGGNKSTFKINLPAGTSYWTYWIGVGQEGKNSLAKFATQFAGIAKFASMDPLVLFGLKLIPALPVLNGTATVSYRFMDTQNASLFLNSQRANYYNFKFADNVASDFSIINEAPQDLTLSVWNNSTFMGQDVTIKVVAFAVRKKLMMEE